MTRIHKLIPLRSRSLTIVLVSIVVLVGVLAPPASAHAVLLRTDPSIDEVADAPPGAITLTFSEPVEIALGSVRVYNTDAERVDDGPAEHPGDDTSSVRVPVKPDLADGTYTVTWRVVSADAHPIKGAFVFHIGAPGSRPEGIADRVLGESGAGRFEGGLFGVARWMYFSGIVLLAGSFIFLVVVWRRRGKGLVRPAEVEMAFGTRWRRVVWAGWLLAVAGTAASVVLQGAVAGGLDIAEALRPAVIAEVLDTRYGTVSLLRLALLGALAAVYATARARRVWPVRAGLDEPASVGAAAVASPLSHGAVAVCGVLLGILCLTPGLAGHAGVTSPVAVNLLADGVHVAAASAWLGGVVLLSLAAWPATGVVDRANRPPLLAEIVARFSDLAVVAIAALVVTGTVRAWVEVGGLSGLTGSTYGLVLLSKLALVVPILILGAINNRILKPRLARAVDAPDATATMKRTLGAELLLGAAVIAATALLVNLAPARTEAEVTGPFVADVRMGDDNLNVLVDPREVGENSVHLTLTDPSGAPVEVRRMDVLFSLPSEGIGPLEGAGRELATGHFVVQGRQISVPGDWTLVVEARLDRFSQETAEVEVTVP
jgi:copper transport protein